MCGIVGVIGGSATEPLIGRMLDAVQHRGPSERRWVHLDAAAFGVSRLAVVDVPNGAQPRRSGERWVMLNGEIYELGKHRRALFDRGYAPAEAGDTALLGQLHQAFGDAFVERLNGPFALAVWSPTERRLLLSRDRSGMRPLYLAPLEDGVAFASELTALLHHPAVGRQLDPVALRRYLTHDAVLSPRSLFSSVIKLGPGESVTWDAGQGLRRFAWWTPPDVPVDANPTSDEGYIARVDEGLRQALSARIPEEVPWGLALSGGIDSSLLALMASQTFAGAPLQTFSVGWADSPFDESDVAAVVAQKAGAVHRVVQVSPHDVEREVPAILAHLDEPIADEGYVASWFLGRLAKPYATVLLTGDGGDEYFRGYPTFQAERVATILAQLPQRRLVAQALTRASDLLGAGSGQLGLDEVLRRFASGVVATDAVERHTTWLASVPPDLERRLFTPTLWSFLRDDEPLADALRGSATVQHGGPLPPGGSFRLLRGGSARGLRGGSAQGLRSGSAAGSALDRFYQRVFLGELLLTKVDRSLAAHGLEGRAPFLDPRVMAVARSAPDRLKLRGLTSKWVLRELAMRYGLPRDIARLKKRGFSAPSAQWLRGPLRGYAQDLVFSSTLLREGWLEPRAVRALFEEHSSGRVNHRKPLWALVSLCAWLQAHA